MGHGIVFFPSFSSVVIVLSRTFRPLLVGQSKRDTSFVASRKPHPRPPLPMPRKTTERRAPASPGGKGRKARKPVVTFHPDVTTSPLHDLIQRNMARLRTDVTQLLARVGRVPDTELLREYVELLVRAVSHAHVPGSAPPAASRASKATAASSPRKNR